MKRHISEFRTGTEAYAKNKKQMTVSVSCTTPATLTVRTIDGETFESVDDLLAFYAFNPRAVQKLREIEQEVSKWQS